VFTDSELILTQPTVRAPVVTRQSRPIQTCDHSVRTAEDSACHRYFDMIKKLPIWPPAVPTSLIFC